MKTIVVTGIGDTRNNGCWAMAASAMSSIRQASPVPVKFIVLNRKNAVDTQRLAFENVEFVPRPWSLVTTPRVRLLWIFLCVMLLVLQGCLYRVFPHKLFFREYWRVMRQADFVLDLSGDSISSDYNWVANLTVLLPLLVTRLIGKPYYLCAQSIGPFGKGWVDRLIIDTLKSASLVTVREGLTAGMLPGYGIVGNVCRTQDLAFLLIPSNDDERRNFIKQEDIDLSNNWVGVSVSSIIASYSFRDIPPAARESAYLDVLAAFCDALYEQYGFCSLFIPHVAIPGISDDRFVTEQVKGRMRHQETCRIVGGDYTGAQLKAIIGLCRFFVGSRMHATIAALSQGIPTITLVYNHKTLGINGDLLGQHDYLIDIRRVGSADFGAVLSDCFARLVANADSVRANLLAVLPDIRSGAQENAWFATDFLECAGPLVKMLNPQHCTGCGTCVGSCPQRVLAMRVTPQGTLRPGLRKQCTSCRICDRVCPALGFDLSLEIPLRFGTDTPHTEVGSCRAVCTGHAVDQNIRFNGSSGGLVTAFASALLDRNEVDAVLVVAGDPADPLHQQSFWATNSEDLRRAQGSRYLPAAINEGFANIPVNAQRLAVVGLPCHLWGVHLLEKSGLLVNRRIVWRLGLFCGRTPSLLAADALLAGLDIPRERLMQIDFRGEGWPGVSRIRSADKAVSFPLSRMWGHIGSPFFTPLHCFVCPDFFAELSDISFGDAWLRECRDDRQGTSLILARTEKAEALLASLNDERIVVLNSVSADVVAHAFAGNIRRKGGSRNKAALTGSEPPVKGCLDMDKSQLPMVSLRFERLLAVSAESRFLRQSIYAFPPGISMRLLQRIASRLNRKQ